MPGDFSFDLKLARARDEINDALRMGPALPPPQRGPQIGQYMNMQGDERGQMANLNLPLGGGLSAGAQVGGGQVNGQNVPYGVHNVGLNYNAPSGLSAGLSYQPQQKLFGANMRVPFQEGGLATSLRNDPVYHDRDVEFLNTRNQRMREVVGKQPYARGGLAMAEGGAWTRKEGKNPEGGLNAKGRASLKAQGHDIKPPVSAKQAKKSPKAAARRKSFCARMSGMPGPMKDEKGRPTRKALSLRKWDC